MKLSPKPKTILDILVITLGAGIYAFGVAALMQPYDIVTGGITGVSILLCYFFPFLPLGMTILVLNTPLFILAWRLLGHHFVLYTAYGTVISSILIDLYDNFVPHIEIDPLMAAIFGGLLMGAGHGLIFLKGATTGGSDIIARLLKMLLPATQMGKLLLILDGFVCILSGFAFGSLNNMLFAIIALYISAQAMDGILYGMNIERVAYIVTERPVEIARAIGARMRRGATLLHGEGAFSGHPKKLILCAVKRQQIGALKNLVREMDGNAFLILSEANEIYGEGFGIIRDV